MIRLNSIPTVVAVDDFWGGIIASGSQFPSSVVLSIVSGTNIRAEWSPEESFEEVTLQPVSAADVASLGTALFLGGALSGTGLLEHYRIAGVAGTGAPIQELFVNWGFANSIMNISTYSSVYGGTNKFGDARKVALRHTGLIYILFSGAEAPAIGHYTAPSSGTNGFAEVLASGSASVSINYGKTYGYASGSNIGGLTTDGAGVAAQYVLTHFDRGSW